ncbi:RNase A-like domain-containing protein [Paraburkholderia ferrariae]|uniref:RNase A-like domain-containing protein n=1 Tax=Paraburkholderia ferrariae TaxID=386056 RepID=UPI0004891EA7|nr:RNase A-like domain-containing protein [Paraburkholderia ferrariae]
MSQVNESDGVRVVLSAPQLAAVLARQSISLSEMLSNRLWGGLQVVGGVLEMVGAAALCVLPEPTMASKAGCVVFGVHGSDTASAGLRQTWTGRDTATLTQQGTTKLAEAMKASPDMANSIGLSLDIVVPFGFAGSIKAARAASVTMGRINLQIHEAKTLNPDLGGHTLLKHVGKNEAWLLDRLKKEPKRDVVSSFYNIQVAEFAISDVMNANAGRIQNWARSPTRTIPLTLAKRVDGNIGYGIARKDLKLTQMNKVTVVLKYKTYNNMPYYILTAFVG